MSGSDSCPILRTIRTRVIRVNANPIQCNITFVWSIPTSNVLFSISYFYHRGDPIVRLWPAFANRLSLSDADTQSLFEHYMDEVSRSCLLSTVLLIHEALSHDAAIERCILTPAP